MSALKKIIHYLDVDGRYLCIKAHGEADPLKSTPDETLVTCKNCIRKLAKRGKLPTKKSWWRRLLNL